MPPWPWGPPGGHPEAADSERRPFIHPAHASAEARSAPRRAALVGGAIAAGVLLVASPPLLSRARVRGAGDRLLQLEAASAGVVPWDVAVKRAAEVERRLTDEERAALLSGPGGREAWAASTSAVPRLSVPRLRMRDAAQGFSAQAREAGSVTSFPSPLALAATWDEETVRRTAAAIGREFRRKGANVMLGPWLNVHRTPWGGRNWEHLSGEDPYLGARLAPPYVQGVQSTGVMTVIGDFGFRDQEAAHLWQNSIVGEKAAWELYFPPFEAAIRAGAGAVRCASNRFNGSFACESRELLQEALRARMGFQGFVMADSEALHSSAALEAGVDMEQPGSTHFAPENLSSEVGGEAVGRAARRVLASIYHLGLDTAPGSCEAERSADASSEEHLKIAEDAAAESIVLLQNDGVLPLLPEKVRTIAVLGAAAVAGDTSTGAAGSPYSGAGAGHVGALDTITPLDGIRSRAAKAGIRVLNPTDTSDVQIAVGLADQADVVIIVGAAITMEGEDRKDLSLAGDTDALIATVAARGKPVVVLLEVPGPVLTPWRDHTAAIAALFYGGERSGGAWASVLFGDRSPSGKLPVVMPSTTKDLVAPGKDDITYEEGLETSYRSPVLRIAFPFGHGLSYTYFEIEHAWVFVEGCPEAACVKANITNMGSRPGREVVQAYIHLADDDGIYELKAPVLRGFYKTAELKPGELEEISLMFMARDLSVYDEGAHAWRQRKMFNLQLGTSCTDIQRSIQVMVPPKAAAARRAVSVVAVAVAAALAASGLAAA